MGPLEWKLQHSILFKLRILMAFVRTIYIFACVMLIRIQLETKIVSLCIITILRIVGN